MFKHGFQFSQRADPFAARELVDLGGHDGRGVDDAFQPDPRLKVAFEARMPRIDQ